jgi:hypothetical protein
MCGFPGVAAVAGRSPLLTPHSLSFRSVFPPWHPSALASARLTPMDDQAWQLASVIARNETRATTIVAALAESQPVTLSSLPLSAYAAEIRRDWRESGNGSDPAELTDDLTVIFDRVGTAVRMAIAQGDWDWGDHPPSSFALWLERTLAQLRAAG